MRHIEPKMAVGYVRCSTEMQEDSPDQQKKEILAFAAQNGYNIIDWYEDIGKSGTTFEMRPGFQRLRREVENHPDFQTVICYDESRWGRAIDAEENTYWKVHFRRYGIDMVLAKTSVDRKNDFAPMLSAFEGVQASMYSKKLSELTLRGGKNNGIYSSGGSAPYGYKRIAVNQKTGAEHELAHGEWCVRHQEKIRCALGDKQEVQTIRNIFEWRAQGMGYALIIQKLNEQGISCPTKGRKRDHDQKWSTPTLKAIIERECYYGVRVFNRKSSSKIQAQLRGRDMKTDKRYPVWQNDTSDWKKTEGAFEPIINQELWEKANSVKDIYSQPDGYKHHNVFLLTGLISCSKCGYAFQGWSGTAHGKRYFKYTDGGWHNKRTCSYYAIPKEALENYAVSIVKEVISEPRMIQAIEEQLQILAGEKSATQINELQKIEKAFIDIENKENNLISAIEQGIRVETIQPRLTELNTQKKLLLERKRDLESNTTFHLEPQNTAQAVADFILNFESKFNEAPQIEKKDFLRKCISQIIVNREKNTVRFYIRKVPAVDPEIERLFTLKFKKFDSVESESARNRS